MLVAIKICRFRNKHGAVARVRVYDLTHHDAPLLDTMSSRLTQDVPVYWPCLHGRIVGLCIPNNTLQVEYECFERRGNLFTKPNRMRQSIKHTTFHVCWETDIELE